MAEHELRRTWLRKSLVFAGGATTLITGAGGLIGQENGKKAGSKGDEDEEVSPTEDLMREHGVLKRVPLIYREVTTRIDNKRAFTPDVVMSSAKLIRAFVEDYHEKLEEDYLFPRFKKANKLVDLTDVLPPQHKKGRVPTDRTMQLATATALRTPPGAPIYGTCCISLSACTRRTKHKKNGDAVSKIEKDLGIHCLNQSHPTFDPMSSMRR